VNDKIVKLDITDLAFDGKAVAHMDGKVVFLKGGLPGETVMARITRSKPRYDQAIVTEILTKSPERIAAPCSHVDHCGGCTWQDLQYESQLTYKKKQVNDCLERLGKLPDVVVHDVIGSVELFSYRNKMEFSFNVTDDGFTLGLHERGHFDRIFDLDRCHLQSEDADRIVHWVRDFVAEENIPVYDVTNHSGYMRFLMIRQPKHTSQLMVNIVTNYGDFPVREKLIKGLTRAVPAVTTIVHNQNGQKSNIASGEIEKVLLGPGYIEERLFDKTFRIRANSFFQTNSIQTETLYRTAFNLLRPIKTDHVMDLYCGTGSIGILISPYVTEVMGVELVGDAVEAARENARTNHVDNISFFEGDVKEFLKTEPEERERFNIIIVDPPRAGLHPKALKRLLAMRPERILYISCNPATFARDAQQMVQAGYELPLVQPVDMFPHTLHIELTAVFYRT
jgi:23S rRNA (uracil1939-C5)-methyltransferase